MSTNLQTIGDIARDLKVTNAIAKNKIKGLVPSMTISNGRVVLYNREAVVAFLIEENADLLRYLGFGTISNEEQK